MTRNRFSLNRFLAAALGLVLLAVPVAGQEGGTRDVERLLGELARPDQPDWMQIEQTCILNARFGWPLASCAANLLHSQHRSS